MIKIENLLDMSRLGEMQLLSVRPHYVYNENHRTDTVDGYMYDCILPGNNYERISVRIDGDAQMQSPASALPVHFEGMTPRLYVSKNRWVNLSLRAQKIRKI